MRERPIDRTIPIWREKGPSPLPTSHLSEYDVVIVGGGPVGLTMALDLGRRGHRLIVLNKLDFIPGGSKAICFSKRTLDIWDRLGVGRTMVDQGVVWNVGRVFWGNRREPVYQFDLLPVKQQAMPAFINLQQYHAEEILVEALAKLPNVDLRWGHEVVRVDQRGGSVDLDVETGDGEYRLRAKWLLACDGARSPVREMLGLDFEGRVFEENFLIADIRLENTHPSERWFWFDPPFNSGRSALLHKQPDNLWRLDFQLGWDIDRETCLQQDNIAALVRGMLGDDIQYEPEWCSVYTFQCRRIDRFVHNRVIFAGDSAHLVPPFGARGCNGGIADADNLSWKLDLVLQGAAPDDLISTYNYEAIAAADENILNSSRSTDFLTPKTAISRAFRDAVLELASDFDFARLFVNSGRLSIAVPYPSSPLNSLDEECESWEGVPPGSPALDAPLEDGWLLDAIGTGAFSLLTYETAMEIPEGLHHIAITKQEILIISRYDLQPGSAYLLRPDHYVAGRWRRPTSIAIEKALHRAKGNV